MDLYHYLKNTQIIMHVCTYALGMGDIDILLYNYCEAKLS